MLRFLLLHRIEWTDRHPALMLAGAAAMIALSGAMERVL